MEASGLEGVVVAATRLSRVDGARGELVVCGARIEALAGRLSFEEAARRVESSGGARTSLSSVRRGG